MELTSSNGRPAVHNLAHSMTQFTAHSQTAQVMSKVLFAIIGN